MRSQHILNGLSSYIHMERYVNGGSRTYSPHSSHIDIGAQFQPTGDTESFEVPLVKVPREKLKLIRANPAEALNEHYVGDDHILFAIHPEILMDDEVGYMKELRSYPRTSIRVSPTASSRTVITLDDEVPHHFLKMHCPRRISRFLRKHRAPSVEQSVLVSGELAKITLDSFAYLPESLGAYVGTREDGWGFSLRESIPHSRRAGRSTMIPFFSLYSHDLRSPDDLPLLIQLIEHHSADPMTFVLEKLMVPLIEGWCHVNKQNGIILAPHGQNVLLEVDEHLNPQRIVHRDFIVYIDTKRCSEGPHLSCLEHRLLKTDEERAKVYSLIYDSFIGHHLFDYLAGALERHYQIDPKDLQAAVKTAFKRFFPDSAQYLDDCTYYYSQELQADNSAKIVKTDRPKVWR